MTEMEKGEYAEPELIKCEKPNLALDATGDNDDPEDGNGSLVLIVSLLTYCWHKYSSSKHHRY